MTEDGGRHVDPSRGPAGDEVDALDELVARAQAGDERAMDELLARLRPKVLRRCAHFLPHSQDAEDAAQEAMLAIATKLGDFAGRGSFLGWVTVIASNSARQTYRTMKRRFAESSTGELPAIPDARTTSVIAGSRIRLLEALEALGERHPETVEAFVLRDLGSLPYDEIAELTHAPLGTVKARIHTARGFVREAWGLDDDNF
jgi:RNA polymerase sigma factor (sigma-70 family)